MRYYALRAVVLAIAAAWALASCGRSQAAPPTIFVTPGIWSPTPALDIWPLDPNWLRQIGKTPIPNAPPCDCGDLPVVSPVVLPTPTVVETPTPIPPTPTATAYVEAQTVATPTPVPYVPPTIQAPPPTIQPSYLSSGAYAGQCGDYPDTVTQWWQVVTEYPWDACTAMMIINRESRGLNVYNYEGSGACGVMQLDPCEYPDDGAANIARGYDKYEAAGWQPWALP